MIQHPKCATIKTMLPFPSTLRSSQVLFAEDLPPSSTATPFVPSPDPSPSLFPSTCPDQPLQIPTTTLPLPSAVTRMSKTAGGSPGTPKFNRRTSSFANSIDSTDCLSVTLNFLNLSQALCDRRRMLRNPSRHPPHPSRVTSKASPLFTFGEVFSQSLAADFGPRDLFSTLGFKSVKEADAKVRSVSQVTSNLAEIPQGSTPMYKSNFISQIRERSLKALRPPSSCAGVESSLDARRNLKGKGKAVRALRGMSDWFAERRRTRNVPPELCPLR